MNATHPTGALPGIIISAERYEGLTVTINGRPGRLAIVDEAGTVVASGEQVASEAEEVAVNSYRNYLECVAWNRALSKPIEPDAAPAPAPARRAPKRKPPP
jgi:hypothetical protein